MEKLHFTPEKLLPGIRPDGKFVGGDDTDAVVIDGVSFKKVYTGYTERQYFSHSSPEAGPGPGWDSREQYLLAVGLDPYSPESLSSLSDLGLFKLVEDNER